LNFARLEMSEVISVSAQLSLLSAAGTFGSTMTDSDDEEKSLEPLSSGNSERALIRNSVDDDEKSKEGISSIYKIGKTLGQ
jgi:hypothetical protein